MRTVLVAVPLHHLQGFVPADPLDGRQIGPGLHQMGNRRVPQRVANDFLGVKPRRRHDPPKGLLDVYRDRKRNLPGTAKPGPARC